MKLRLANGITSNVFKAGHRIGIHVTSSLHPHLDRNPNTGGAIATEERLLRAEQLVHHDAAHPSRVVLPVIPASGSRGQRGSGEYGRRGSLDWSSGG